MAKRKALGKGLGALIPSSSGSGGPEGSNALLELDISQVKPNRDQPRTRFEQQALEELSASIKEHGILQPLVVRKTGDGYQIIVGERRWRAAQMAGLRKVPALLQESDDVHALELALIENIQRQDLNPLEEAQAYQMLIDRFDMTQEQVAERVGRDRSTVTNILRLLRLHDDVKKELLNGTIEMGHARALLAISDVISQREICSEIIKKNLTVREVENRVKKNAAGKKPARKAQTNPFIKEAEMKLSQQLESRVEIKPGARGGKIVLKYSSEKELNRLYDLLMS
jgi:ParB family chromosome partitioning protein